MPDIKYLQPNELLKVLEQAKRRGPRDHAMFLLAYKHGLRVSEVSKLTLVDLRDGYIDVDRAKDSLHTRQKLESHANPLLDEKLVLSAWLRERPDTGSQMLFVSRFGSGVSTRQIFDIFAKCAELAGIESGRRNPHVLKHSVCAHLVRAGVSIAYIQQLAGHKHITSTQVYLGISQDEAVAASSKAMAQLFAA
jgi:type 1 fimbriae regulatory protein FimB